jgi:hypothetical protein
MMNVKEVEFYIVVVGTLASVVLFLYCVWYLGESSLKSFRAKKSPLNPKPEICQYLNAGNTEKAKHERNVTGMSFKNVNRFPDQISNQNNHEDCCQKGHEPNPIAVTHISSLSNLCIRVYRLLRRESTKGSEVKNDR